MERKRSKTASALLGVLAVICTAVTLFLVGRVAVTVAAADTHSGGEKSVADPVPGYEKFINNLTSAALEGLVSIPKEYWLAEDVTVAPEPAPENFGSSSDPADSAPVLAEAERLLDWTPAVWSTERTLMPGSAVRWYLDETICAVSWKEIFHNCVYSFAEVKVAHPSQFRRYLADNTFASPIQYRPSELAATVNAVAALSADFYKFRGYGIVVYQRKLYRAEGNTLDMCFVDGSGNLNFVPRGTLTSQEAIEAYIDGNDILFSLAFGPVLIDGGENAVPSSYPVGEIGQRYARCVLCQLGECHYLLVTATNEDSYTSVPTLEQAAEVLLGLGVKKAYTLDGGQTATLIMNDEVVNRVVYGYERTVSDIIYFATALPEEGGGGG